MKHLKPSKEHHVIRELLNQNIPYLYIINYIEIFHPKSHFLSYHKSRNGLIDWDKFTKGNFDGKKFLSDTYMWSPQDKEHAFYG